ncbi:hypothetical protein ABH923_000278 [Leifsonia sp. EB41]|uniref:hypothetical protein n=1 Tax=Leifsonia sp. EB41 TaxID=3156260 RepID=UPI003518491B
MSNDYRDAERWKRRESRRVRSAVQSIGSTYQAAQQAGDDVARQAALDAAEKWIKTYKSGGTTSFSFDELSGGKPGISYTNMWNDNRWLL